MGGNGPDRREETMKLLQKLAKKGPLWSVRRGWHGLKTSPNSRWRKFLQALFRSGEQGHSPRGLFGIYDLNANSPSYNFLQFLMCLENHAAVKKVPGYTVVIVPKQLPDDLEWKPFSDSYGREAIDYRSVHLLSQLAMLGTRCRGVMVLPDRTLRMSVCGEGERFPADYGFHLGGGFADQLHQELRRHGVKNDFQAPPHADRLVDGWFQRQPSARKIVTITLRESPFDPVRNSNLPEWIRFAAHLEETGYQPVIIPDTDAAFSHSFGFMGDELGSAAAFSPAVRLAVYRRSFLNFFVPNGPYGLAVYSSGIRYVCVKMWLAGSLVSPATPEGYKGYLDPATHNAYWASWGQWHTGEMDTYDNLVTIFGKFVEEAEKHRESILQQS